MQSTFDDRSRAALEIEVGAPPSIRRRPDRSRLTRLAVPAELRIAPRLDPDLRTAPPTPRHALLLNPFYAKDPHASFGKHVLTPTLALTSIAGGDAARVERAVLGREPAARAAACRPVPAGRRHHRPPDVRQARLRAGALVPGARREGRPRRPARALVPGGSARRTPTRSSSARACRSGREILGDVEAGRAAAGLPRRLLAPVPRRPRAAPQPAPARELPDDDEPDRDARLPQPLRLLLPVDRGPAHALPDARRRAGRRRVPRRRPAVRRLRRQQPRLAPGLPAQPVPRAAAAREDLERRRDDRRHRRPLARARDGARRLHGRVHRLRVADGREPRRRPQEDAAHRGLRAPRRASCTTTASR